MHLCRRNFLFTGSALSTCCWLPQYANAEQTSDVPVDEPGEEFGCGTLDPVEAGIEITNFSPSEQRVLEEFQITDYGTFIFAQRWRKSDGMDPKSGKIVLGCHFLNGNARQRARVAEAANEWLDRGLSEFFEFRFGASQNESQIRIHLGGNRNNSYIGRQNKRIRKTKPTMNLANFNRSATVQHEFGHALGLRHEHRFPGAIEFDEDVVVAAMKRSNGWTTAQTYLNILKPLNENSKCLGDPNFNANSIMMYDIPKSWTKNGVEFHRSGEITEGDIRCLVGVYSA